MPRHRTDPGAFVAGLFFLAVAGIFLATGFGNKLVVELMFLAPAMVIGFSLVLLIRIFTRSRRRDHTE